MNPNKYEFDRALDHVRDAGVDAGIDQARIAWELSSYRRWIIDRIRQKIDSSQEFDEYSYFAVHRILNELDE